MPTLGRSGEDVRANVAHGQFGIWEETGRYINLAVAVGGTYGLGYGGSVGKMIVEDGLTLPTRHTLREAIAIEASRENVDEQLGALADLLALMTTFDLPSGRLEILHPYQQYSVQGAASPAGHSLHRASRYWL